MDPEFDAARAGIRSVLVAQTHVAQQSGEERAMDRAIAFILLGPNRGIGPVERFLQLLVHIAPFAHARIRKKIVPA